MPIGHLRSTGFYRNRALVCERFPPKGGTTNRLRATFFNIIVIAVFFLLGNVGLAGEVTDKVKDHVPKPGAFPPKGAGIHMSGDLVFSEPFNRRGGLRNGDGTTDPRRHYFAMLPYGTVWYHGAPADIRDIPHGTHMHGRFLLPMEV